MDKLEWLVHSVSVAITEQQQNNYSFEMDDNFEFILEIQVQQPSGPVEHSLCLRFCMQPFGLLNHIETL